MGKSYRKQTPCDPYRCDSCLRPKRVTQHYVDQSSRTISAVKEEAMSVHFASHIHTWGRARLDSSFVISSHLLLWGDETHHSYRDSDLSTIRGQRGHINQSALRRAKYVCALEYGNCT